MSELPTLDCHPASPAERTQVFENVFDVWRHADTNAEHVRKRAASPQHNRARWFVGCLGNRVVASLGCYPMKFLIRGREVKGFAIGAVHTIPACRGRGYAARLLDWAEHDQAKAGAEVGILFSDIAPEFYGRLGYTLCPSMEGWISLDPSPSPPRSGLHLTALSGPAERPGLMEFYAACHRNLAFSILRDDEYWAYLFHKGSAYQSYWLMDDESRRRGYVILSAENGNVSIQDFAVPEAWFPQLIAAVMKNARSRGFDRVGGWLPESPAFADAFALTPRTKEITMIKFLNEHENGRIDLEMRQAAGRIHEIDHV